MGSFLATGFATRARAISAHIMPVYADVGDLLARLGTHKPGQSCLCNTKLVDIDQEVSAEPLRAGPADLGARWPVHTT